VIFKESSASVSLNFKCKMLKLIFLIVSFCCISLASAQTFQYSRGWTNGKRSGSSAADSMSPLRQMTTPLLMTANELNNRERYTKRRPFSPSFITHPIAVSFLLRLLQHIIKNPCDVRAALLSGHKLNDDYSAPSAEFIDDDAVNRFKRDLNIHQ
jgi:hypothetical protein